VGLGDFIAGSEDEYISIAVNLAEDVDRLAEIRRSLRAKMEQSPLMDAQRFARSMESAFRKMWRTWCEESPSEDG
jgi:predicted O-linked N-acetylglucosamine transferase (SPINDLY family)